MPLLCAVFGCANKSTNKELSFYRFPKTKKNAASDINALITQQRESWFCAINEVDSKIDSRRICSVHFKTGKPAKYDDLKNPDWKPTLKMGYNNSEKVTTPTVLRCQRVKKRLELKPAQSFQESPNTSNIIIISS